MTAGVIGRVAAAVGGIAVVLMLVQGAGVGSPELFGPDMLLAVAGFLVTRSLLDSTRLAAFYRRQLLLRVPVLSLTLAAVVAFTAALGTAAEAAHAATGAVAGLLGVANWWDLAAAMPSWRPLLDTWGLSLGLDLGVDPYAEYPGRIDALGAMWLVGLLAQLALCWPPLLAALRRLPGRLWPLLLVLAGGAALVGPLRALAGAGAAELTLGTHVRIAGWLLGAAAAAFVAQRQVPVRALLESSAANRKLPPAPSAANRKLPPAPSAANRKLPPLQAGAAVALLVSAGFAVTVPATWLRCGGPAVTAAATALLLVTLAGDPDRALARHLGRGLPQELGRVAWPLLVLHLPVLWLVQRAVPQARPFALLAVGGALTWLLALVLQDGLLRRIARRPAVTAVGVAGLVAALAAGTVSVAQARPAGSGPLELVLGGADAGELANALASVGRRHVLDGSRPGCGLLAAPPACAGQSMRWAALIEESAPAAIVVDLAADTTGGANPCDAAFRAAYRHRLSEAIAVWTAGAPDRPVLVADGPVVTRTGRCLDALLTESVAARGALVRLPVQSVMCPSGTCDGTPNGTQSAVARLIGEAVSTALISENTRARAVVRAHEGAGSCDPADPAGGTLC